MVVLASVSDANSHPFAGGDLLMAEWVDGSKSSSDNIEIGGDSGVVEIPVGVEAVVGEFDKRGDFGLGFEGCPGLWE